MINSDAQMQTNTLQQSNTSVMTKIELIDEKNSINIDGNTIRKFRQSQKFSDSFLTDRSDQAFERTQSHFLLYCAAALYAANET